MTNNNDSSGSAHSAARVGRLWHPGIMSSLRSDWATPWRLFEMLNREFHFQLDACATDRTTTCRAYYAEGALRPNCSWRPEPVWCNPPYGRRLGYWIEKAFREARLGSTIVLLLPARTDTQWFHDYCLKGEIRFLRGRLSFDDQGTHGRAPFPSMIVIFRGGSEPERAQTDARSQQMLTDPEAINSSLKG